MQLETTDDLPPPPPPYIATREEFDRKTAVVIESSLEALSLENQASGSHLDEEIFEEWDEAAFEAAAAAFAASQQGAEPPQGTSASALISAPITAPEPQFQPQPQPTISRSELPAPPQPVTTERIQPLTFRKRAQPQPPAPPADPPQLPKPAEGKERPKWYSSAQLDGSSSSSANISPEVHAITQDPFDDADGDVVDLPPPPFSAQGPDLNGPPFEPIQTNNTYHSQDSAPPSPLASPPHRHMSLPPVNQAHNFVPDHLAHPHRHQSLQPMSPSQQSASSPQQTTARTTLASLHSQGGPRIRMFDSALAYGPKHTGPAVSSLYQPQTASAGPSAFYNSTVSSVVEPNVPFKKRPGYKSAFTQPSQQNPPSMYMSGSQGSQYQGSNASVYSSNASVYSSNSSIRSISPTPGQFQASATPPPLQNRPPSIVQNNYMQQQPQQQQPYYGNQAQAQPYTMRWASNEGELNFQN